MISKCARAGTAACARNRLQVRAHEFNCAVLSAGRDVHYGTGKIVPLELAVFTWLLAEGFEQYRVLTYNTFGHPQRSG